MTKLSLPDDILQTIQAFAEETAKQKRLLAYCLQDFLEDIPHGQHMTMYELIADEWNNVTGEIISGRTVRYWVQSVKTYSKAQMETYQPLTDAQLIEAVKLASDCQNEITPQEICDWCIANEVRTIPAMRANWLPLTGTPEQTDPPALSGIIRLFGKLFKKDNPHQARIQEIINELRTYLV